MAPRRLLTSIAVLLLLVVSVACWLAPAAPAADAAAERQTTHIRFGPSGSVIAVLRNKRRKTTGVVRLGAYGHLDRRFAGDGMIGPFQSLSGSFPALDSHGRLLFDVRKGKRAEFLLRRYLASGQPDRTFGGGSGATVIPSHPSLSWPDAIRTFVEPSGEILVSYHTTQTQCYRDDPTAICDYKAEYLKVHRYSERGRLLARRAFYGEYWEFGDAAQTADGELVVAGAYNEYGTTLLYVSPNLKHWEYRYLEPSEDEKFQGFYFLPRALALLPGGDVALAPKYESTIRRFRADGAPEESFGDRGTVECPSSVPLLRGLKDGTVLAAGGSGACGLARYRPDGSPDPSFGTAGFVDLGALGLPRPETLTLGPGGKFAVAGWDADRAGTVITLFTSSGHPDPRFGTGGSVVLPGRLLVE